jgi:hypothetical protein
VVTGAIDGGGAPDSPGSSTRSLSVVVVVACRPYRGNVTSGSDW